MSGPDPAFAASPSSQSSLSRPSGLQSGVGFTPGPWTVTHNSWETSTVYQAGTAEPVAECPISSEVDEDTQDTFEPIKEANANLIAAAPDLYEALTELLRHEGIAEAAAEDIDGEDHARESAARRALAKARGEV